MYCKQVCIKEIVHNKRKKAEPFILAAKKVYNKTTKGKYNIISPDFLFQQSRHVLKNFTSDDTGSDWMLSFIIKFKLSSKISGFF